MLLRRWQSEAIRAALHKYQSGQTHFMCLATPGAGKTHMASMLAREMLDSDHIDLVICFSPSVNVSESFQVTLERCLHGRMDGLLGSKGRVLTYQSMLNLASGFWDLFSRFRVLAIFDEIHHCSGDSPSNANTWGQTILRLIQGRAAYTLALTGTPWRSDKVPIVLASYCQRGKVHCDYSYGLRQAIADGVCRIPRIITIDNEHILLNTGDQREAYASFSDLLTRSNCSYLTLLHCDELIAHMLRSTCTKLGELRQTDQTAGALIVTASVEHAVKVAHILYEQTGERAAVVTYMHGDAQSTIHRFRNSADKWIVSVGMISEGTDIPRLKVCCHLTHVKTELYFRQILGRILRAKSAQEEGFLFLPAEPRLMEFARRVSEDIPEVNSIKLEHMSYLMLQKEKGDPVLSAWESIADKLPSVTISAQENLAFDGELSSDFRPTRSVLSETYDATLNLFGKYRQHLIQLSFL